MNILVRNECESMYNMITNLVNEVYDGKTSEFLGYATFELAPTETAKLLQLVNYGKVPESIILSNLDIVRTAEDYAPPTLTVKYPRIGILRALFRDDTSGVLIPIEIHFTFDVRGRGQQRGNLYHFDSVEYSNIKVDEIKHNIK